MFTYNASELSDALNRIRFLVQDTVEAGHFFENEEISYALEQESNPYRVAAELCRAAAAKLARMPSQEDATITFDSRKGAEHYLTLAKTYDAKAASYEESLTNTENMGLSLPTIGNGSDTLPAFTRGLHFS